MPRYTKDQLTGFVADRRYWDKKHPEHQAHLDFTVKAFEETYPDPLVPTPEQEEWAAAEEKRLREMAKLRPFWDKRDPGHAQAYADVTRGFDKINAVLYGTQDPDDAAPASAPVERPMRATRDPLDPVMPSPTSFAQAASAKQSAQARQAPQAQQAPEAADVDEDGFRRQPSNRMSWPQFQRNFIENEGRAPAPGNPNRTLWQAQSEQAQRGAEAARQRAIQQEQRRTDLDAYQRQLQNRAPEDWDRERPMPQMTNPVPGAPIRAPDNQGGGRFGDGRGHRPHYGADIETAPGADVVAPVSGKIVGPAFDPYRGTRLEGRHLAVQIETDDGYRVRVLYLNPSEGLRPGTRIERGQRLGTAQDIAGSYGGGMTNHVHMDVQRLYPIPNDRQGRPPRRPREFGMFVDPTPYIREN